MENTCEVNDLPLSQITLMHAPNSLFHIHIVRVSHVALVNVSAAFMHAVSEV